LTAHPTKKRYIIKSIKNDIITGCTEFRYPGTIFTKDGRDTKNIRHRVTKARKIISALNGVWLSKDITRNRKKMIYNNMV